MTFDPLPILPLETVLFPRMPLPLQVSNDGHAAMIARCVEAHVPFGVVLVSNKDASEEFAPAGVGTLARIHAVKHLENGAVSIFAVGTERFRVIRYLDDEEPYLRAVVEPIADDASEPDVTHPLVADVSRLFNEYFRSLVDQAGIDMPGYDLPEDPVDLSFVIAAVVQADSTERQALLETTDTAQRLTIERTMLEEGNALVQEIAHPTRLVAHRLSAGVAKPKLSRN